MEPSDEALIAQHTEGDASAFAELTERYLKEVYSFAVRLVGNQHAAEDITQDTFVKVWKSIGTYNVATSRFKTWLLRIARNTAIDYLRRKKSLVFSDFDTDEGNTLTDSIPDTEILADDAFAKQEDAEALGRAMEQLSTKQREILTLHYTNDLTFEEIGELLGEPGNTVKSRHRRALLALRDILHQNK